MQIEITLTLPLTRLLWISICTNLNLNLILLFFYPHPPSKGWVNSYSFTISKISNSLLSENLLFHPHMRVEKYFSTPIQGWKSTFPPSYESEKLNLLFDPIWGWKSTSPPHMRVEKYFYTLIWGWKSKFGWFYLLWKKITNSAFLQVNIAQWQNIPIFRHYIVMSNVPWGIKRQCNFIDQMAETVSIECYT